VSKQWASALQQEWACQYKFENSLQVKHSVNPSTEPLAEANSQVFFIKHIAKPLIDMTTLAVPGMFIELSLYIDVFESSFSSELKRYSHHCAENLFEWEQILEEQKKAVAADSVSVIPSAAEFSALSCSPSPSPSSSSLSPLSSPTSNTMVTNTPLSGCASPRRSYMIPVPLSTTTSGSLSYTSSLLSSGPSRMVDLPDNDYSTAFRLTLPRGGSCTSPTPVTPGSMMMMSMVNHRSRIDDGMMSFGSGTFNAAGASGAGVMLPSESRTAIGGGGGGDGSSLLSCSCSSPCSPCHCAVNPPPRSRSPIGQSDSEVRIKIDEYRFPPTSSNSILSPLSPAPALDPLSSTVAGSTVSMPCCVHQTWSGTSSVSPTDSGSWISEEEVVNAPPRSHHQTDKLVGGDIDNNDDDVSRAVAEEEEREEGHDGDGDEYELNLQARRVDFHNAVSLGLGASSLKRKQSRNVLRSLPFGYSPSPTPPPPHSTYAATTTTTSSIGGGGGECSIDDSEQNMTMNTNTNTNNNLSSVDSQGRPFNVLRQHNLKRASWCSGESWDFDMLEFQVKSREEAKETIEGWTRGRWGSARFLQVPFSVCEGEVNFSSSSSLPPGDVETDGERGLESVGNEGEENGCEGRRDVGDGGGIESSAALFPLQLSSSESGPCTPPKQVGSFYDRSGSLTPKAKPPPPAESHLKPCETEGQKRKRQEKERQKLIDELIRDEEKEKRKVMKRAASMNSLNVNEKDTRSKSRTKKKGKGRK